MCGILCSNRDSHGKTRFFHLPQHSLASVLLSTLTLTSFSAAPLPVKCSYRSLTEQCLSRVAQGQARKRCFPCRILNKNLLTILPEIYTGFLPSLSDKGPNVTFPMSIPAKNRDDARLNLQASCSIRYHY